jgi:hypothetical protein
MIIGGGLTSAHLASLAAAATAAAAAAGGVPDGRRHGFGSGLSSNSNSTGGGGSNASSSSSSSSSTESALTDADGGTPDLTIYSNLKSDPAAAAASAGCQAGSVSLLLRGELRVKQFDVDIEWMGRNRGSTLQFGFRQLGDMGDRLALMRRVLQVRQGTGLSGFWVNLQQAREGG